MAIDIAILHNNVVSLFTDTSKQCKFSQYMGPDQAVFAAVVRTRLAALAARIK